MNIRSLNSLVHTFATLMVYFLFFGCFRKRPLKEEQCVSVAFQTWQRLCPLLAHLFLPHLNAAINPQLAPGFNGVCASMLEN